jgi:hypothetical protein
MFSEFLNLYLTIINTKNKELIVSYTDDLCKQVETSADFALAFTSPASITAIHSALVGIGIPNKALMLRNRVPNPTVRAKLMSAAIKVAVSKL